jgi:hypothetical protein
MPSRTSQATVIEEDGVSLPRIVVFININDIFQDRICRLQACVFTVSLLRSQLNVAGLLMILEGYGFLKLFETGSWIGWCSTEFTFIEPWRHLHYFRKNHEAVFWEWLNQILPVITFQTRGHALFSQWARLNYGQNGCMSAYTGDICSTYIHYAEDPHDLVSELSDNRFAQNLTFTRGHF